MADKPVDSWRARAAVSEALDIFNSQYMQDVWAKALARRETDPEGAVTSARTLLESVCKHILDSAEKEYREGEPLPRLYKSTAELLEIAPTEHTAPILTSLFTACAEIVESVGRLRNHLSDSHGRGPFGTMPDWRHAELAVNLSAAMATYLAAIWKGRQPTVRDMISVHLANRPAPKDVLGDTARYTLERMARDWIGDLVASKIKTVDLVTYFGDRRGKVAGNTIWKEFVILRTVIGGAAPQAFREAGQTLRKEKLADNTFVSRERRVPHHEFDAVIAYFREQDKHANTKVRMAEIAEFAVWSGRPMTEILSLRWGDVDFERRTCKLPDSGETFPLLENAWEVIRTQRPKGRLDPEKRIFPYVRRTVSSRHTLAKNALAKQGKVSPKIRFLDLRYEAASRLLERGHQPHDVARATGQDINKVVKIFESLKTQGVIRERTEQGPS